MRLPIVRYCRNGNLWGRLVGGLAFAFAFILTSSPAHSGVPGADHLIWRTPANDGLNSLFIQLKTRGMSQSYSDFCEQFPQGAHADSFAAMVEIAARFGYALAPARLSIRDLAGIRGATMVHLESCGPEAGQFAIFLGIDGGSVNLVSGGSAEIEAMSLEQFRRRWSGYALAGAASPHWSRLATSGAALVLSLIALRAVWHWARANSSLNKEIDDARGLGSS